MIKFFDVPTQVKFFEPECNYWMGGIGVEDYIICGCCGSKLSIEEIYEMAAEYGETEPIVVLDWIDINDSIIGG